MKIYGWGKYPQIKSNLSFPKTITNLHELITQQTIARGMGRSYGDSALASHIISTRHLDYFQQFDCKTGILRCAAGVTLHDILKLIVPRGWFLPVTPGTQFITIGGAVASDVHGKNHHTEGSFSAYVTYLNILLANGEIATCSPHHNIELFYATCGGMGLTGIILSVELKLKPIQSAFIHETMIKTKNLSELIDQFEQHKHQTYSVAWIDCLATGSRLGRSLLMLGEHATDNNFKTTKMKSVPILFDTPSFLLNQYTVRAFNYLYYQRVLKQSSKRLVHYNTYFYPLDKLQNWNRLYGKNGFTQYQFVIPKESGPQGLTLILQRIARSQQGSFLSVLKTFGKANHNYLSFPMEGYTLALDFKIQPKIFKLLDELDRMVLDFGGRIYLAKDARMSAATFKQSYPDWQKLQAVREKTGATKIFRSLQSTRLGFDHE